MLNRINLIKYVIMLIIVAIETKIIPRCGILQKHAVYVGLIANKITKIYGILNANTNYILSTMEKRGKSFSYVLDGFSTLNGDLYNIIYL